MKREVIETLFWGGRWYNRIDEEEMLSSPHSSRKEAIDVAEMYAMARAASAMREVEQIVWGEDGLVLSSKIHPAHRPLRGLFGPGGASREIWSVR